MNAHMQQVVSDVERAIQALCIRPNTFATRDEIAEFLLADPLAHAYLDEKAHLDGRSIEWIAGNTVDWFSAWMTRGMLQTRGRYERRKLGGKWAYRPTRVGDVAATRPESPVDKLLKLLGG
jgi:hypothetical protein